MTYRRPQPAGEPLRGDQRRQALETYFAHYREVAKQDPTALNQKISREPFGALLDAIGQLLLDESGKLSQMPGPVRDFLDANPLPTILADRLPADFRVFCLSLNALKQWVAAEQAATDRYLLGGTARAACRSAADGCIISGEPLGKGTFDFHHPVRDGRPPLPLAKHVHASLEGQVAGVGSPKRKESGNSPANNLPSSGGRSYRSSRLSFRADVIEKIGEEDSFQVETPEGTFEMTRAQFYTAFPNVVESRSYREHRAYSYSTTPRKALPFLLPAKA